MKEEWLKYKKEITAIVELIEDKEFPARRNITDYLEAIFGYPKDMAEFISNEYKRLENEQPPHRPIQDHIL